MSEPDANGWMPIETAPMGEEFLAFGSYLYEGDSAPTVYMMLVDRTGKDAYPFASSEGLHVKGFFSHWQRRPEPPTT